MIYYWWYAICVAIVFNKRPFTEGGHNSPRNSGSNVNRRPEKSFSMKKHISKLVLSLALSSGRCTVVREQLKWGVKTFSWIRGHDMVFSFNSVTRLLRSGLLFARFDSVGARDLPQQKLFQRVRVTFLFSLETFQGICFQTFSSPQFDETRDHPA